MLIKNSTYILLFVILCTITSCGTLNKIKKNEKTKSDSTVITTTITTNTIITKADTTITPPVDSARTETNLPSIIAGDTNTIITPTLKIETFLDKKKNKIITKVISTPKPVHVLINKTEIDSKKENKKTEIKKQSSTKTVTVKRSGAGFSIGFKAGIGISILLLLIVLYIINRKKLKQRFPFLP